MKTRSLLLLMIMSLTMPVVIKAQTFEWWKENVQWDGATNWWKYIVISPKYFGPNALSVPVINNGSADTTISLGATVNFHFSNGDNTQNLMLYGNYTTKSNTISVDAQLVPYERFQMSHAKKTERKVYYTDYYKKTTVGDAVISTTFQVFQKWRKNIHFAFQVGVRMPSGGLQGAARYADIPAYWLNAGAAIPVKHTYWKWIGTAGFMAWQTNSDDLRQDDAFLFGLGGEFNKKNVRIQAYGAGYIGYENNGDKPIVLRFNIEKKQKRCVYLLRFQQGLHDFSYFTVETGLKRLFR